VTSNVAKEDSAGVASIKFKVAGAILRVDKQEASFHLIALTCNGETQRKSMSNKSPDNQSPSLALAAMAVIGLISAVVVAGSFYVISYWPLPVSVAPLLTPNEGFAWGLVAGGVVGLVIGWLTDDKHFADS